MRTAFDGDRFVDNIAFDACSGCQPHFQTPNAANNAAVYHDVISDDFALNGGAFADGQQMRTNIAFDITLNDNITSCLDITLNCQVCGQC